MRLNVRTAQAGCLFSDRSEPARPLSRREKSKRREVLFRETAFEALARRASAAARAIAQKSPANLWANFDFCLRDSAIGPAGLPDPAMALGQPDGLCGLVADLNPDQILEAFRRGLHPAASVGPLKYWSPIHRME